MLRRNKSDVLKDLPPKIIQDYYCELSPLQKLLYEDFAKSKAKRTIDNSFHENDGITKDDRTEKISHIFQVVTISASHILSSFSGNSIPSKTVQSSRTCPNQGTSRIPTHYGATRKKQIKYS